jgi:hypothetical protein
MKKQLLLLLLPFLMAFQCEEDDTPPFDVLNETGLFGLWEIQAEVINGSIDDMLPKCCEFLQFSRDGNPDDFKGFLTYTDAQGLARGGIFEADTTAETVTFIDDDNNIFIFEFSVDATTGILSISFTEEGMTYTQNWVLID